MRVDDDVAPYISLSKYFVTQKEGSVNERKRSISEANNAPQRIKQEPPSADVLNPLSPFKLSSLHSQSVYGIQPSFYGIEWQQSINELCMELWSILSSRRSFRSLLLDHSQRDGRTSSSGSHPKCLDSIRLSPKRTGMGASFKKVPCSPLPLQVCLCLLWRRSKRNPILRIISIPLSINSKPPFQYERLTVYYV